MKPLEAKSLFEPLGDADVVGPLPHDLPHLEQVGNRDIGEFAARGGQGPGGEIAPDGEEIPVADVGPEVAGVREPVGPLPEVKLESLTARPARTGRVPARPPTREGKRQHALVIGGPRKRIGRGGPPSTWSTDTGLPLQTSAIRVFPRQDLERDGRARGDAAIVHRIVDDRVVVAQQPLQFPGPELVRILARPAEERGASHHDQVFAARNGPLDVGNQFRGRRIEEALRGDGPVKTKEVLEHRAPAHDPARDAAEAKPKDHARQDGPGGKTGDRRPPHLGENGRAARDGAAVPGGNIRKRHR